MPGSASDYLKDIIESLSSSKESAQIIEQIKKINPKLQVSSVWRNGPGDNPASLHYTGQAVDFAGPLLDLFNTFVILKDNGFIGGIGLGIDTADRHLHVDLRPNRNVWFETSKSVDKNGKITVTVVTESNSKFNTAFERAKKQYFVTTPVPEPPLEWYDKLMVAGFALGGLWIISKSNSSG